MNRQPATDPILEMAPVQGFTDHVYRRAYGNHFTGISHTYCPYIMLHKGAIRSRDRREREAERGRNSLFTPQIIAATPGEATTLIQELIDHSFERVNLNLGCPHPPVTRRHRGSGLLPFPDELKAVLTGIFEAGPEMEISIKTRLGLEAPDEMKALVPIFNSFPLAKIIIHPRTGRQLYRGDPHWDEFSQIAPRLKAPVLANGDIEFAEDARTLLERSPSVTGLMLGRGLLQDPFLPARILGLPLPGSLSSTLQQFHDEIFEGHLQGLSSKRHVLDKMQSFWRYFSSSFDQQNKLYKQIKKTKRIADYQTLMGQLFSGKYL